MTENGPKILKLVRETRKLHFEMKKVLEAADGLMQEKGWEEKQGNYCHSDYSQALFAPQRWMPRHLWRSYNWPKAEGRLLGAVSIVIDDEDNEKAITEPILIACVLKARSDHDWSKWSEKLFLGYLVDGLAFDGKPRSFKIHGKDKWLEVGDSAVGCALELAILDSVEKLNEGILAPLHAKVEELGWISQE